MPVGSAVLTAGYMNPVIFSIAGFHDELIEIGISLKEIKPASGHIHIGMLAVVVPGRI